MKWKGLYIPRQFVPKWFFPRAGSCPPPRRNAAERSRHINFSISALITILSLLRLIYSESLVTSPLCSRTEEDCIVRHYPRAKGDQVSRTICYRVVGIFRCAPRFRALFPRAARLLQSWLLALIKIRREARTNEAPRSARTRFSSLTRKNHGFHVLRRSRSLKNYLRTRARWLYSSPRQHQRDKQRKLSTASPILITRNHVVQSRYDVAGAFAGYDRSRRLWLVNASSSWTALKPTRHL